MATTREYGAVQFICDECETVLDTKKRDFREALAVLREADWSSEKTRKHWGDGEWVHLCDECKPARLQPVTVKRR